MSPLPVSGWERDQVTYRHLIRPVVAFVRDHGPVPVERVHDFISTKAAGDLSFASPTKDRQEAARLVLNLLVQDIDTLTVTDGIISVASPHLVEVKSELFDQVWKIPSAEDLQVQREKSLRQRTLREWATRNLFRGKWRNGIRKYSHDEIQWMADQIEQYGYVGPKIVRDDETGAIIDGVLRVAALKKLGIPAADHTTTETFVSDMHRLAYIIAVHTLPGARTRIPISLRNAILKEVIPHGTGFMRNDSGALAEPTPEDWLTITGRDFTDHAAAPESEDTVLGAVIELVRSGTQQDKILTVMDSDEWVGYNTVIDRLHAIGYVSARINRTMAEMADNRLLERRQIGNKVEYRPRQIPIPENKPTVRGRTKLPTVPKTVKHFTLSVLLDRAKATPDEWVRATELDAEVNDRRNTAIGSTNTMTRGTWSLTTAGGTLLWDVNGEPWKVEIKKEGNEQSLRVVRG